MTERLTVSERIDATPDAVYAMVSDLPRMGEWSPENNGGRWLRGAGPHVGARFVGRNGAGRRRWSTLATVTVAEPGRSFAFRISVLGLPIAYWEYRFEPADGGCRVEESWSDLRPRIFVPLGGLTTGVSDRATFNEQSMRHTLDRRKAAAEAG